MKIRRTIVAVFLSVICLFAFCIGCSKTQKLDPEALARKEAAYPAIKSIMEKYGISDFDYLYPKDFVCAQFEQLTSKDKWQLMKDLSEVKIKYTSSDTYPSAINQPNLYIKKGDTSFYYYISKSSYSTAREALSFAGEDPSQALYPGVYYREETKKGDLLNTTLVYREEN